MRDMIHSMSFPKLHDKYWGSNITFVLGVFSLFGFVDILLLFLGFYGDTRFDTSISPGSAYGFLIILGALLYKARKKQRFQRSKTWLVVELLAAIFLILTIIPSPSQHIMDGGSFWFFAFSAQKITLEYRVPAIISVLVLVWTLISYFYVWSRKVSDVA